jgi:uncharacterized protein YndB with AHSA1/START domain
MAKIAESVEINCPIDKVFIYTTDAKSWPKWHGAIPEAEQTSQGPMGVGTTFEGKSHMMGMTSKWTAKTTEYETNKKWGKIIDSGSIIIDDKLLFDTTDKGTKFMMVYDVKVSGFLKLLSSIIMSSMHKQLKLDVITLKRLLEA